MDTAQSKRFRIEGKVQGVWFRRSTKQKADELGIVGTVRNLDDGSVECLALGSKARLEAFEKWCWKGSPLSKVSNVIAEPLDQGVLGGQTEMMIER